MKIKAKSVSGCKAHLRVSKLAAKAQILRLEPRPSAPAPASAAKAG